MRALIVGPDTWICGYVQRVLTRECGHLVTHVCTAEDGIRALHAVEWDALVTDIRLDEDAVRTIRSSAPRWQPCMVLRMIRGRPEDFLRCIGGGLVPIRTQIVAVPPAQEESA